MEIRKISVDKLSIQEILAVLDIAQGVTLHRPDWQNLKQELTRFELCGIYDGEALAGFAQVNCRSPYLGSSIQMVSLRYHWQYNQEPQIAQMIRGIGTLYPDAQWMVMDVDARRDFNCPLYQKLGFQRSTLPSPLGQKHMVLICSMETILRV